MASSRWFFARRPSSEIHSYSSLDLLLQLGLGVADLLLGEQAGLDPLRELDLLLRVQQRDLADLLQVVLHRVRGGTGDHHLLLGLVGLVGLGDDEALVLDELLLQRLLRLGLELGLVDLVERTLLAGLRVDGTDPPRTRPSSPAPSSRRPSSREYRPSSRTRQSSWRREQRPSWCLLRGGSLDPGAGPAEPCCGRWRTARVVSAGRFSDGLDDTNYLSADDSVCRVTGTAYDVTVGLVVPLNSRSWVLRAGGHSAGQAAATLHCNTQTKPNRSATPLTACPYRHQSTLSHWYRRVPALSCSGSAVTAVRPLASRPAAPACTAAPWPATPCR